MNCHRRRHHSNLGYPAVVVIVSISCLLLADMSSANYTRWCTEQETKYNPSGNNLGYCGRDLSRTLESVCRERGYNGQSAAKCSLCLFVRSLCVPIIIMRALTRGVNLVLKTGGVVGPGFKTRGVVDPKNEKEGGREHRIEGIPPEILFNHIQIFYL